ncbi:MAG: hypothetical protein ACP5IZ_05550 [Thermoprotei archaeon]|jgi:predicted nucleotidyltransferase
MELLDGYAVMDDLDIIYYVVGLPKNNGVWAYPKYIPDPFGDRTINNKKYKKLSDPITAINYLRKLKPTIIKRIGETEFPLLKYDDIKYVFNPKTTLQDMIERDTIIKELVYLISNNDNKILRDLGITGSRLLNASTTNSDIDLIFYGNLETSKYIYQRLKKLRENKLTRPVYGKKIRELWKERSDTPIDYKLFKLIEKRKIVQGIFKEHMYSIKLFDYTAWNLGSTLGATKFKGVILDDTASMLFPPSYIIKPIEIIEGSLDSNMPIKVISYRSRFWEIAPKGSLIKVQGILQNINNNKLVIINYKYGRIIPEKE